MSGCKPTQSQTGDKDGVIRSSGVDTSLSRLQQIITQPHPSCTTDFCAVQVRITAEVHHLVMITAKTSLCGDRACILCRSHQWITMPHPMEMWKVRAKNDETFPEREFDIIRSSQFMQKEVGGKECVRLKLSVQWERFINAIFKRMCFIVSRLQEV